MKDEVTSAALLGIDKSVLGELVEKGIAVRGAKRGSYWLETVTRYCAHLRDMASARGGEEAAQARARLGQAQAALAEAKAAQLRSELVETDAVEKLWTSKLRAFRNRILGRGSNISARGRS